MTVVHTGMPEGWSTWKFEEVAQSINDRVDNPTEAGVTRYVGLEHLDPGEVTLRRWGSPDDVSSTKLRFQVGDVIYGRRRAYQRKLAVAPFQGIASAHALVLRARSEACLPEFLPYFLQSDAFHERAVGISVGSLSPTINWKTLKLQEFALPPLEEQKRICEVLDAAELVCTTTSDAIQRLWEIQVATIEDRLFRRDWQLMRLEGVLTTDFAGSWGADITEECHRQTMVVRSTEMTNTATLRLESPAFRSFTERELSKLALKRLDIVVEKSGGTDTRPVGRVALWDRYDISAVAANFMHVLRPNPEIIHPNLLRWALWRIHRTGGTLRFQTASTNIRNLRMREYLKQELPVPPLGNQSDIVKELEAIEETILDLRRSDAAADEARRLVRESLLTGASDVQ